MQNPLTPLDRRGSQSPSQVRVFGGPDFRANRLGLSKPAIVLFHSIETDDQDQISLLEQVINSVPIDISAYVLEKESMNAFAQLYDVKGSPTYLLFESGSEKGRMLGKADFAALTGFLERHLSLE